MRGALRSLLVPFLVANLLCFHACSKEKDDSGDSDTDSAGIGGGGGGGGGGGSDATAPSVGAGPNFSAITKSGFTVSWTAATDDVTEQSELEYQLVSAPSANELASLSQAFSAEVELEWTKAALSKNISGLPHLTTVAYAVLVRDAAGNIGLYPAQEGTTLDADAPVIGAGITFGLVEHTSFSIYWGLATSRMSTQAKLKYKVVIAPSAAEIDSIAEAEALTGSSVVLPYTENRQGATALNVSFGKRYFVSVLVKDEQGRTSIYAPASVETLHHRLIFATTESYAPTFLASVSDADAACEAAKPSDRTAAFKALFVGGSRTACTNPYCNPLVGGDLVDWPLKANTPYESVNGLLIFTTDVRPIVAANATINQIDAIDSRTWTGIKADWTESSNNCQGWTSAAMGVKGDGGWSTNSSPAIWSGYDWNCIARLKIYCVEQ